MNNFLYSGPNRLYLVINGTDHLIREPFGWPEAQISVKREKYHGFTNKFPGSDLTLRFHDKEVVGFTHPTTGEAYEKAKELIDAEVLESGADADFKLRVEYLFDGIWNGMPEIKLDLTTYDNQQYWTSLTTKSDEFEETVKNLLNTKVNLATETDVNGVAITPLATEDVWYHSKVLRKNDSYSVVTRANITFPIGVTGIYTSEIFEVTSTIFYCNFDFNNILKQEVSTKFNIPFGVSSLPPIEYERYNNLFEEAGDLTIDATVWLDIYCYFNGLQEDCDWSFYSALGNDPILENNGTAFLNADFENLTGDDLYGYTSGYKIRIVASIDIVETIDENVPFYYWVELDFGSSDLRAIRMSNLNYVPLFPQPASNFTIQIDTVIPQGLLDNYPLYDTFDKIMEVLTGDQGAFISDFFEAYQYLHIVNGNILKGQAATTSYAPKIELDTALNAVDAVFNTGWNIEPLLTVDLIFTDSVSRIQITAADITASLTSTFTIVGTGVNDGEFTVTSSSYLDGVNTIFVNEVLVDGTYEGYIVLSTGALLFEGNRLRLEDSAHFYNQDNLILDLTTRDVYNYREVIATDYIYNEASFGYPSLRYDELNTTDEFNTEADYLLLSRNIKNKYSKISPWKTQGYDIEFLRRQALKTDSTAFEEDEDIYLMQTFIDTFSTIVTFSSADDSITVLSGVLDRFLKGRKFTITGSVSNNGTFSFDEGNYEPASLAYKIFLNENAVTESSVTVTVTMFYKATESNEKFTTLTDVISPETVFNAKLSPARNYLRHATWLNASQNYKDSAEIVRNTGYEYNGEMVSKLTTADDYYDPLAATITQNQNFELLESNQFNHLAIPTISKFTVNLTFDEAMGTWDASKGKGNTPYGHIKHLNWLRQDVDSWLLSLKGSVKSNEYDLEVLWWRVDGVEPPDDLWVDGDGMGGQGDYVVDGDGDFIKWHL